MSANNKPTNIDGWNDPPANLTMSDTISTKRVLLNKRVAYTNQELGSSSNASSSLGVPPTSGPPTVTAPVISASAENSSSPVISLTIEQISSIFNTQIEKLEKKSNVEKKVLEDIQKKFQLLCDDWSHDKLTLNTKQSLAAIFQALEQNQVQEAFDLHVTLVRLSGTEVVRFIVAIKRLIQELQRLSQ